MPHSNTTILKFEEVILRITAWEISEIFIQERILIHPKRPVVVTRLELFGLHSFDLSTPVDNLSQRIKIHTLNRSLTVSYDTVWYHVCVPWNKVQQSNCLIIEY